MAIDDQVLIESSTFNLQISNL